MIDGVLVVFVRPCVCAEGEEKVSILMMQIPSVIRRGRGQLIAVVLVVAVAVAVAWKKDKVY